jgi:hypothetical protein
MDPFHTGGWEENGGKMAVGRSVSTKEHLPLFGILLAGLIVRIVFFTGISASDPLGYAEYAYKIATGSFVFEPHHYNTRFAVTAPVGFFFRLFGVGVGPAVLWPMICSLATILLVYRLGLALEGRRTGLIAATLFAFLPLDIALASDLFPEGVMTAMMTLAVYSFHRGYHGTAGRSSTVVLLIGGAALWAAYSAKMLGVLLLPLLALYVLLRGRHWRRLACFYSGFAALLLPELIVYKIFTGDWLFRQHAIAAAHEGTLGAIDANVDLFHRLFLAYPGITLVPHNLFGLTFILIWCAFLYGLSRRGERLILLLWFAGVFAYVNFGSSSLTHFVALPFHGRYLHPATVPGVLLLASLLARFWGSPSSRRQWRRTAATGALAIVLLYGLGCSYLHTGRRSLPAQTSKDMRLLWKELESKKVEAVYTDPRSCNMLFFLSRYTESDRLRIFPPVGDAGEPESYLRKIPAGAFLLFNWREFRRPGRRNVLAEEMGDLARQLARSPRLTHAGTFGRSTPPLWEEIATSPLFAVTLIPSEKTELLEDHEFPAASDLYQVRASR